MKPRRRSKRANRVNPREDRNQYFVENAIIGQKYPRRRDIDIRPKNPIQKEYVKSLLDENVSIVICAGPAGTGKTYLAVLAALKALNEGVCDKIVITRPNIAVDDNDIGFLPGDIFKKMIPWMTPILDVFKEYYSPKEVENMLKNEVLEIVPIAYIRGRTFKNTYVLVDEAQGTTKNSMLSILTRVGENSKMLVTGDIKQSDIGKQNGLQDLLDRYNNSEYIKCVLFDDKYIERSPVVAEVLKLYKET